MLGVRLQFGIQAGSGRQGWAGPLMGHSLWQMLLNLPCVLHCHHGGTKTDETCRPNAPFVQPSPSNKMVEGVRERAGCGATRSLYPKAKQSKAKQREREREQSATMVESQSHGHLVPTIHLGQTERRLRHTITFR